MQAGMLYGSRDIRLEEIALPIPDHDQVLLRIRRAGICGSDIHYFAHGYCGAFVPTRPFVLGHEFVAIVDAVGSRVASPRAGQRVVVNPAASCGHCEPCRQGRGNLCRKVVMLGSASTTPPTNGAFADYVVVPAHQCYVLPDSISDSDAAMMEPLSVALHAVNRAGGVAGLKVLVCGAGPIGLLVARMANTFGATLVVVSEPNETRRELATRFGADATLNPLSEKYSDEGLEISHGGFDCVFEASGAAAAVRGAMQVAKRGGVIVQIGTINGNDVTLPVNDLMVREISLLGTFRYADEFPVAIDLVSRGRVSLDGFVTATLPLTELANALHLAASDPQSLKVHVVVD